MHSTSPHLPHLGFEIPTKSKSTIKNKIINKVLQRIEKELHIFTSTPTKKFGLNALDMSFSKSYEEISRTYLQAIDNDSGYASHNQESNSESADNYVDETSINNIAIDSVYLNEDALQEKPMSAKKNLETEDVYQEFTDLYYVNSIIDASLSEEKLKNFIVVQDSDTSINSQMSDEIPTQEQIVVTQEKINTLNGNDYITKKDCIIQIEDSFNESQNNHESENIENDSNFINIAHHFNKTKEHVGVDFNKLKNIRATKKCTPKKRKRSLSTTPQKIFKNPINPALSPDLFSDDDIPETSIRTSSQNPIAEEQYIIKKDQVLLKRINKTLNGVLPPPSLTKNNLTVDQILEKLSDNKSYFWDQTIDENVSLPPVQENTISSLNSSTSSSKMNESFDSNKIESLLVTTDLDGCLNKVWPKVLDERYHGLHHNRSKLSEDLEALCMKYSQRYIGAETQSSCTVFDPKNSSPFKRKANRLRWQAKSPGRRLSHLARRRITFSSANLQAAGNSAATAHSRQIMVDAKRYELLQRKKSPRKCMKSPRKTPRKSPRKMVKTPTSSMKKNIAFRVKLMSGEDGEAGPSTSSLRASVTKRALFQSPEHKKVLGAKVTKTVLPSTSNSSLSPWKKKNTPKRALFTSPVKNSPSKRNVPENNKRKRLDSSDDFHPSKLARNLSVEVNNAASTSNSSNNKILSRIRTELNLTSSPATDLSAHHKKKLQWAVYEALRGQSISVSHPQFKQFASVLARITRKFLPNLSSNSPRPEGGTSERMLRITKQHVFAVTKGKTVEEIVQTYEQARNSKTVKPSGYVSVEQAKMKMDVSSARIKETAFQDKANTINSVDKLNKSDIVKPKILKSENRVDRVRKVINFDDNSGGGGLFR